MTVGSASGPPATIALAVVAAASGGAVRRRLSEPFTQEVDGVTFGWQVDRYEDGTYFINIAPGDFIAYYAPWDGLEYDT